MDPFDLVGDVLDDQYRIDECAGEGVLSVVYRGRHLGVDADVAVKCLNLPPTMDEALAAPVAEGFRQAVRLHYRLARGNLHIAQTIASGTTIAPRTGGVVPYMVREWFEGESLAKDFQKRREESRTGRSLEEVLDLFQGAADALRYAHSQGIPHLSLTPSNFFLTHLPSPAGPRLTIKVLDFGVGRTLDVTASDLRTSATPSPGLHLLTPAYAAPEQLSVHVGMPGPASDVYVFALVLLEALSDRMVMDGKDTGQIVTRALDRKTRPGPKDLPIALPPQVESIFERALAVDPAERFPDVGEFWEELLHADVEITSSSRDPSLPPPNFDEEEPTAEMPMEMLEATKLARDAGASSHDWEPSSSATARIRGPSLFRRLRHWRTLGMRGKSAAAEAEREEGPISMPPAISITPGPTSSPVGALVPAPPRAPAIPSWHPAPLEPGQKPHRIGSAPDAAAAQRPTTPPAASAVAAAGGGFGDETLEPPAPTPEPAKPAPPPKIDIKAAPPPAPKPEPKAEPPAPAKVEPPKVEPPKVEAAKVEPAKVEPAKVEPPKPAKVEPPKPAAKAPEAPKPKPAVPKPVDSPKPLAKPPEPKAAEPPKPTAKPEPPKPPVPLKPGMAPPPKRQPTLVMFEHGVDVTAAARTSSPSSPGLGAGAPDAPAAPAAAPPVEHAEAPPPPAEPAKPLPPPPPADVLSALEGMEAAPVPVPPAAPSSASGKKKDAPGALDAAATAASAPAPTPTPLAFPPPPPPPPPPEPPADPMAVTGPPALPVARAAPQPFGAIPPPPQSETVITDVDRRRRRGVIAAIVSFAVVLTIGIGVVIRLAAHGGTPVDATPSATTSAAPPPPSASATASAPPIATASASVAPKASASAAPSTTSSAPKLPTQPKFYKNLATRALDKVAKDLHDCRDRKGRWGQSAATVNFLNDGTVKDVYIASPYTGTSQGKCVEDKIKTAQMAPFLGKPYPVVYYFVIPP